MRMIRELDPELYLSNNFVVLDIETTNKDYGNPRLTTNRVVVLCWFRVRNGRITRHHGFGMQGWQDFKKHLEEADFMVAHSAQFELKWMRRMGFHLPEVPVYCTLLGAYVQAANRMWMRKDLDSVAKRMKIKVRKDPVVKAMLKAGVCPSDISMSRLGPYCMNDVYECYLVFLQQREELKASGQLHLVYQRSMMSAALSDISFAGLYLDRDVVYTKYEEEMVRYRDALAQLEEIAPINWNSADQKRDFLYEEMGFTPPCDHRGEPILTDAGKLTTKTELLMKLEARNEAQRTFLPIFFEYAQSNSRLTKTLQFFKGVCDEYNEHFYGNINQGGSQTHRLTSSGAPLYIEQFGKEKSTQFQNIDRTLKSCIRSRTGWLVGDTDAASLEFRVAIELTRDTQGYIDLATGHDPHRFSASEMLGIRPEDVDKAQRQAAKSDTFKPLYYGRSGTDEQRRYYAAFRERYPDIAGTQEAWIDEVLKTKRLELPYGMIYYWPKAGLHYVHNQVCNYPVQGFATAEIVPLAVVKAWDVMDSEGLESHLNNTVHDSIVGNVHPDEAQEFTEITQRALTDDMYGIVSKLYNYDIAVQLGAETQIGPNWSTGDEVKYEVETPPNEFVAKIAA